MKPQPDVQGARARARDLMERGYSAAHTAKLLCHEFFLTFWSVGSAIKAGYTTVTTNKRTGEYEEKEQHTTLYGGGK